MIWRNFFSEREYLVFFKAVTTTFVPFRFCSRIADADLLSHKDLYLGPTPNDNSQFEQAPENDFHFRQAPNDNSHLGQAPNDNSHLGQATNNDYHH